MSHDAAAADVTDAVARPTLDTMLTDSDIADPWALLTLAAKQCSGPTLPHHPARAARSASASTG